MAAHPSPRREVVTGGPRGTPHGTSRAARPVTDATRAPAPDDDRLRQLIRLQWRATLVAAGTLVLLLGSLPLVFSLAPAVAAVRVAGIGIAWWVLGVLAYPVLYLIGRRYVARAEANEERFTAGTGDDGPVARRRRPGGWE
jgi:hypothetical protein